VRLVLDVVIAVVAGAAENIGLGGLHFLDGDAGSVLAIALRAFRTAEVVLHAVLAAHRILAHRQHSLLSSSTTLLCLQGRIKHLVGPTHFTMPGPQSLC